MKLLHTTIVAATMLGIGLAPATYAQATGSKHNHNPGREWTTMRGDPLTHMDRNLSELKAKLNIRPDQESAWQSFSDAVKQQSENMHALHETANKTPETAPDKLDQRAEFMKQRATGMETVAKAMRQLYTVLTPEQKSVLDNHDNRHQG